MRSCEAQDEIAKRRSNGLQQCLGESWWKWDSERIPVPCGIFDSDVARASSDLYAEDAACANKSGQRSFQLVTERTSGSELSGRQIAQPEQQIVNRVSAPGVIARVEMLELPLNGVDDRRVEQFAKLRLAQQLAQLRMIDRQGLRAALGQRRITVVQKVRDVAKQQ